jgi:hypothetical protein
VDVDIFVSLEPSRGSSFISLAPIYDYLRERAFSADKEYIVIGGWPVQFLTPADALGDEALEQAIATEVEGVKTWVIAPEYLVAISLKVGRTKDYLRILQFAESGQLDSGRLNDVLSRHGMLNAWKVFEQKYLQGGA